jgi:hypothetical protein
MENQKKPDLTSLLIIILVIFVVSLVVYLGNFAIKNNLLTLPNINFFQKDINSLNTDSIYLSNPIKNLYSAQITAINPNSITVSVTPVDPPEGKTKVLSFKIGLTDTTEITKPKIYIPYSFKKISNTSTASGTLTINNLSVGEYVDITLANDLRTTSKNALIAKSISKISESNMLTGKITAIGDGFIKVNGIIRSVNFNPAPSIAVIPPTEKSYFISYSSDTEIVTDDQSGVRAITPSDFTPGVYVTVYANKQISGDSLSAALISAYSLSI